MDALLLSRMQFAANISFHILFPMITIALGWVLVGLKLAYNRTNDMAWMQAYQLWVKVFAVTFALGVVSGITMSFQFGTNWPGFMEVVGNVAGPLLAYEIMTAFFLEAVFLGVMLFGFSRVSNRLHTAATIIVAIGTTLSAFWILVLNSWMQTPQGFEIRDGVIHATDWLAIVFSPSMPYRFVHVLLASGLTAAFLIAGLSAYRWLRGDRQRNVALSLKVGIWMAAVLAPLQIVAGDFHGLNTLEHQPQKVAAMEANWETRGNVPLVLFAIPDEEARTNRFAIAIPNGASLILKHDPAGVVPGLNDYVGEHPPVAPVFFAFRIMVGMGFLMLALSWFGAVALWRRGEIGLWPARAFFAMTFSGWIATLAGWYTTEIGRQPWLVSGVLKTADAVGEVPAGMVASTLVGYVIVYVLLLLTYIGVLFLLARKAGEQPVTREPLRPAAGAGAGLAAAE
jgi:cytochrome bd ubiquinol oxidase subunit I